MPATIHGKTYYRTAEACQIAGISKATLFRWLKSGILEDVPFRDRKGWRLFTADDIDRIKAEADKLSGIGPKASRMDKKILIIEDDRSAARLTEYTLQEAGYQVITASDGIEGLGKALTEHPDLIILGTMLPGLDGYEVCHQLRQKPETATLPILMTVISTKTHNNHKDSRFRMGADDYLTKPAEPSEILGRVETLLSSTN